MLKMALIGVALFATAALAQPSGSSSSAPTTRTGPSGKADQVVCVSQTQIGSRLNRRRVCRTRAEWEQHQAEYKQEVERAQQQLQTQYVDPDGR